MIREAVLRGTVDLRWHRDRLVTLIVQWDPSLFAVGNALFAWPVTEGIESLWLDGASLWSGDAALASRLASVRRLCLNTTPGDSFDLDWVSSHAPLVERFVTVDGDHRGAPRFARATSLDICFAGTLAFYERAHCPEVTELSVGLAPELGADEARALVAAFPRVRTLRTIVQNSEHRSVVVPVLELLPLESWTIQLRDDGEQPRWMELRATWR